MDESSYADLSVYITRWKMKFPHVTDLALIGNRIQSGPSPPKEIPLIVETTNDAYYKLSTPKEVLKGGLFKAGANFLKINVDGLFKNSGSYLYFLELKAGDLIIRKEIGIDIQVDNPTPARKPAERIKEPEYKLSLYVGGEVVISSKKSLKNMPLKIDYPKGQVYMPKFPLDQEDYFLNTFSILDAVAALYGLARELTKDKSERVPEFKYQKQQQIEISFLRPDPDDGVEKEIRATIRLKTRILS
jgi:hypothetical protein